MPRFFAGLAALAIAGLVAACSPATPDWTAPGANAAETEADWAACRSVADARVGPVGGSVGAPTGADPGAWSGGDPLETYDRQKAEKTFRSTIEACMRGKGYYPSKAE